MSLWHLSPVLFAAGFALLYSKKLVTRISGGCIVVVALGAAWDPQDVDDWYMAVVLAVVGLAILLVFRPPWLRSMLEMLNNPDDPPLE